MQRQTSPTRKIHKLAQLNASAWVLALAGLRSLHHPTIGKGIGSLRIWGDLG